MHILKQQIDFGLNTVDIAPGGALLTAQTDGAGNPCIYWMQPDGSGIPVRFYVTRTGRNAAPDTMLESFVYYATIRTNDQLVRHVFMHNDDFFNLMESKS